MAAKKFVCVRECPHCFRKYKSKVYYDRHISACELLHKSSAERNDDVETDAYVPDSRKLYEMILALAVKNKALEERVEELTKCAAVKKKKLHVKEWLDQNYSGTQTFDTFVLSKSITDDDYKDMCKYDYVEGISIILKKMFPLDTGSPLPIQAFGQKDNTLFVKNDDGWNTMSATELEGIVASISKQLMTKFVSWQEANKHRIYQDSYTEEYMDVLQKLIGNCKGESSLLKIKRNLYKHLKTIYTLNADFV